MKTSDYIYGLANRNQHGNLDDAVKACIITREEARLYNHQAGCIMLGRRFRGKWSDDVQFRLDKFFKRNEIDYEDFKRLCRKLSGDKFPVITDYSIFIAKKSGSYYLEDGKRVEVDFKSRFED